MRLLITMAAAISSWIFAGAASACNLKAVDAAKAGAGCARAWMDANLHMNDILTVGTHNSYHAGLAPRIASLLSVVSKRTELGLDYHHGLMTQQLDDGDRALELDLAYDPKGGRYAHPQALALTFDSPTPAYVAEMSKPGMKVLHIQDLDFRSTCDVFVTCLKIIRGWSLKHPNHVPILITMNTNDEKTHVWGGVDELTFDEKAYDGLDAEIRSVFTPQELITPDQIQAGYPTLREGVLKHGWPTLGEARGKFLFALDEGQKHIAAYQGKRHSLEGRVLFVNTDENSPASAYLTLNEKSDGPRIAAAVKAGFIVRTRADADTVEARNNDTSRRDAAFASGAQYVSTDYRHPDTRFSNYEARLPHGAIALCNPQRSPERCGGLPVEP